MAEIHFFLDTYEDYDYIQKMFNAAESGDTIYFHGDAQPKTPARVFEIGEKTIKINKGNVRAPFKLNIVGVNQPVIHGTSPGLMNPPDPKAQQPEDCGIFYLGPWCSVDISELHLIHQIPAYDPLGKSAHGSATIANLVDNSHSSFLNVSNCKIETNATTAISVRSDSGLALPPGKHHILISGCTVTGTPNTGKLAGNFSATNLGFWGKTPLDMTAGSKFEVSNCTLDSLFMGVAVWNVRCGSDSIFRVQDNHIGMGHEGTALGVSFICRQLKKDDPFVLPKGHIDILHNKMKIGRYLEPTASAGAVGVLVQVNEGPQTTIAIRDNCIYMVLPEPQPAFCKYAAGIVCEQMASHNVNLAHGVTVTMDKNEVFPRYLVAEDHFEKESFVLTGIIEGSYQPR